MILQQKKAQEWSPDNQYMEHFFFSRNRSNFSKKKLSCHPLWTLAPALVRVGHPGPLMHRRSVKASVGFMGLFVKPRAKLFYSLRQACSANF